MGGLEVEAGPSSGTWQPETDPDRRLVDSVGRKTGKPVRARWAARDATVPSALHVIAARYAGPLTIGEMADAAALSKFHFIRRFRQATGATPGEFLRLFRVARAMDLLNDAPLAIGRIAGLAGYRSSAAFSRAFQRVAGMSPFEYRSALRGSRR